MITAPVRTIKRLRAVVIRADGRREDLGIISYSHPDPWTNWLVNRWIKFKEWRRGYASSR